jgi:hypothetical protein
MSWLREEEALTHLRLVRIHPKAGGCAIRIQAARSEDWFRCSANGRHGSRLPYFVADDIRSWSGMLATPRSFSIR